MNLHYSIELISSMAGLSFIHEIYISRIYDGYDLCLFFDVLIFFIYKNHDTFINWYFLYAEIRSSRELIRAFN